jgi:hypothetical protein
MLRRVVTDQHVPDKGGTDGSLLLWQLLFVGLESLGAGLATCKRHPGPCPSARGRGGRNWGMNHRTGSTLLPAGNSGVLLVAMSPVLWNADACKGQGGRCACSPNV